MSMEFSKEEMTDMESILSEFLKKSEIKLSPPVDIFKLANELGFDVRAVDFPQKLDGMLLVNENIDSFDDFFSNKVIAYNVNKCIEDKKFIVAHELAHYIEEKIKNFDTRIVVAARDHEKTYSSNVSEQRKDYIAAAILVPMESLLSRMKNRKNTESFFEETAEYYRVDCELIRRRIREVENFI